jgi:hypothetical protein
MPKLHTPGPVGEHGSARAAVARAAILARFDRTRETMVMELGLKAIIVKMTTVEVLILYPARQDTDRHTPHLERGEGENHSIYVSQRGKR